MVFRKPYAFLIKNFKKIHILMLLIWGFIYYKLFLVKDFVKEFISFGTYSNNLENISNILSFLFYLSAILMILISVTLLLLLRYKKKPWKLYLILVFEYIFIMYSTISLTTFFKNYDPLSDASSIYFNRDILNISSWIQYVVLIILLLRITGLDLKKFGFNNDKEFLELNSSDREEFEVNIEFDKHSISRKYNLIKRNINYFYQEHKFIVRTTLLIIIIGLVGYSYYYFGIKHKSYKEGQTFTAGIYNITVEGTYVTDKDYLGNIIEKGNKFILMKVRIKNTYSEDVNIHFSRYHMMNKSIDKTNTLFYDSYFKDMGNLISDDNTTLHSGQEKEYLLVYKVDKKLDNKKFVLYFQEYNKRNDTYLRKIRLNIKDISQIKNTKTYNFNDQIEISEDKTVAFDHIDISNQFEYSKYSCDNGENCRVDSKNLTVGEDKKILKITFASSDYEGKEFIDFSSKYGKIKYVDSNDKTKYYSINSLINTDYEGKEMFIDITNEIAEAKEIYIEYTLRDKQYIIKIK